MKLSIIFTSVLATMAIASPATNERVVSRKSSSLLDAILDTLGLPNLPEVDEIDDLKQCLRANKTYHTNFTRAEDGEATITNVVHTCCEMGKALWIKVPADQYRTAVFTEPCDAARVTGVSKICMNILQDFFDSV